MRLFYEPEGRLRLTLEDRSFMEVRAVWASPMSLPGRYLAFIDGKDNEIMMVTDPSKELSAENWAVVEKELERRYLTGFIKEIIEAKTVFGYTYWTAVTDRGQKDFVTMSLQENAQWLSPTHLLLQDVDGNRQTIPVEIPLQMSGTSVDSASNDPTANACPS